MQNDLHNGVSANVCGYCADGENDSEGSVGQREKEGFVSTGYRWLEVNEFVHVYTSTTLISGGNGAVIPLTQVLAYVQRTKEGKYRALRAWVEAYKMNISEGDLSDVKNWVEQQFYYEVQLAEQLKNITLQKH